MKKELTEYPSDVEILIIPLNKITIWQNFELIASTITVKKLNEIQIF